MKKMNKFVSIVMTGALAFGAFTACGGTGGAEGELDVLVYAAGYGYAWVEEMGYAFEELTGTKVTVTPTYEQGSENALLMDDNHSADLIFFVQDCSIMAEEQHFLDLTDSVYNKTPYGEDDRPTIKELAPYANALNIGGEGKYYAMSYAASKSSLLYNDTTLSALYPDGYTLPNTTAEWVAMLDDIKTNHADEAYGLVSAANYMEYLVDTWWAQYDGAESYFNYWKGIDSKTGQFCATDPTMTKSQGRLEALQMLESVFTHDTGYCHPNTDVFWGDGDYFKYGQSTFVGQPYGGITKTIAFYPCGDWFENEMRSKMGAQNIKIMKTPVISTIVNTFEDATDKTMSDAKLSEIIGKIDDGVAYSQAEYGCAQSTYETVKAARSIVSTNGEQMQAVAPITTPDEELVADFLRFMVSTEGQRIYAQEMKGLSMGYGYDAREDDEVTVSAFAKSSLDCFSNAETTLVYRDLSQVLTYRGGLEWFLSENMAAKYSRAIYLGQETAEDVYNFTYEKMKRDWTSSYLQNAGLN